MNNIIDPNNFDPKDLYVSNLITHPIQALATIGLNGKAATIKTQGIKLTQYGIPRVNDYHPTDESRMYIQIPFDPQQPSCMELKSILKKADEYFASENFRKKLFGFKYDSYNYLPSVREKIMYENSLDVPKKMYDSCKVKFMNYNNEFRTTLTNNGKKINVKTVTDLASYVRFMTTAQFTIRLSKIWVNKCKSYGQNKITYGLGLSMERISLGFEPEIDKRYYVDSGKPIYQLSDLQNKYKDYLKVNKNIKTEKLNIEI